MGVKLVMEEKEGGKVVIGVSKENCDPIIETVEGYMEDALKKAKRLLEKAELQWNTTPKYPKYKEPKKDKVETKPTKAETKKPEKVTKGDKSVTETVTPVAKSDSCDSCDSSVTPVTPQLPLLAAEPKAERKCRVCGCTQNNPCEGGCSWVEKDLCSACAEEGKEKPGLYLQDGRGPFNSVQEALDAYGAPKDTRPQHNRYDRLSKAWQQIIIRKV